MEPIIEKRIKLIWDFRGPVAQKTAEPYLKHLQEYVYHEELKYDISGVQGFSEHHATVFLVVSEFELQQAKEDLRPHRGEWYVEN